MIEKLGLEELRLQFDREIQKRNSFENKVGYIISIYSLILAFLSTFIINNINLINRWFLPILFSIAFLSSIVAKSCYNLIKFKKIDYPLDFFFKNSLFDYLNKSNEDLLEDISNKYIGAIEKIHRDNLECEFYLEDLFLYFFGSVLSIILFVVLLYV